MADKTEKGMDLLLWRHAEAAEGSPDAERVLTLRGEKQARRMAEWLKEHGPKTMRIIVSPSKRTRQTVEPLTDDYELSPLVGTSATADELLTATGWPNADDAVLVVGHQPTLGEAAAKLLGRHETDLTFKKGAIWWFKVRHRDGIQQTVLKAVIPAELT